KGGFVFGDVRLATTAAHANGLPVAAVHYPVAVRPVATVASVVVDPTTVVSVQAADQQVTRELVIRNEGDGGLQWEVADGARDVATTLSHSLSDTIVFATSIACSLDAGFTTVDNSYLRRFDLDDFGIAGDLEVTEVTFGVEEATPHTLTVNLYAMADAHGPFEYGNFQRLESVEHDLPATNLSLVTVPLTATVPAGASLVLEVTSPDLAGVGKFFLGANGAGQTGPSYIRTAPCDVPEPTDVADIGFPLVHWVMSVTGQTSRSCVAPDETPWLSVAPQAGSVAPGQQQAVEVTFDSTGLTVGEVLSTDLCLETNDEQRPLVVVPLTLSVADVPVITVNPEALEATQVAGRVTAQVLQIG